MDTLHPRAEWESVGDKWFRKTQLYTQVFDQDLDLDNYIVTGAPYAGALGVCSSGTSKLMRGMRCETSSVRTLYANLS